MPLLELRLFQLFWLAFAHYLADFSLQHTNMARYKREDPWMFFAHCMIWTGTIVFALQILGIFQLWHLPFLFFGHLTVDFIKPKFSKHRHLKNTIDQSLHLIQIIIVWL